MLNSLFLLTLSNKTITINKTKCLGRHSYRDISGKCRCKPNYFGDPNDRTTGCWTCNPRCHKNAICKAHSQCMCNGGYFGDGIISCKPISFLPKIEAVYPATGRAYSHDHITLKMSTRIPDNVTAYVKFNSFVVKCNTSLSSLHCQIPWMIPLNSSLKASYNGKDWSRDNWYFAFVEAPEDTNSYTTPIFVVLAIVIPSIVFIIPCNPKNKKIKYIKEKADDMFSTNKTSRRKLSTSSISSYGDEGDYSNFD